MAYTDIDDEEELDDQQQRERKGARADDGEVSPPAVQLPSRTAVASPLDSAKPMPTVASPLGNETMMAPATPPIVSPWEQAEAQHSTAAPHVASPLAQPNPYAEYNAKVAAPSHISQIHNPFLRTLAHIGDIAGSAIVPGATALIPGTTLNERLAERHALGRGKALEAENEQQLKDTQTQAATEETGARTEKEKAETEAIKHPAPKPKEEDWEEFGKDQWVNGESGNPLLREKNSGQVVDAITKQPVMHMKNIAPVKPETQEQNKLGFQNVVSKVAAAGLPTGPGQLDRSLDAALKNGVITKDEHSTARGYQSANTTPATNLTVHVAGAEATQAIHNANQWYRWKDPGSGKVMEGRGTKVPTGVEADPIGTEKDFATHQREGKMTNAVQQSFNRVAEDVDKHPELFDNATARNIMATTLEQIDRTAAEFLVAGTGGQIPLPSGMGDMINTGLQNNALDEKTARVLKDYIADYRGMKDMAVVLQMEMQGGKIGRGSQQVFQAIVNQLPNGSTPDSQTARKLIQNFQQKQDMIQSEHADDGKEKPYQLKEQGSGGKAEIPDGTTGTWRGQPVVRQGGKWVIAPAKQ